MKVILTGSPKEIADFVAEIQSRRADDRLSDHAIEDISERILEAAMKTKTRY